MKVPLLRRESIKEAFHVLTFDAPDAPPARPGQFAMLRGADWGDAPLLPRPMSYLGGGPQPRCLVKICGEGTRYLGRAEPGDEFVLTGPLGTGWPVPEPSRLPILVAGGVGIAPLLFLAEDLINVGVRPILVYGARTSSELVLLEDARELCEVEVTTEDGSLGRKGRVTDALAHRLAPHSQVFTCGPNPMMAKVAETCRALDVPCTASLEAPMACGFGVCLGCAVPTREGGYLYACVDGPCVDAQRIAFDVLLANGGHL